MTRKNSSILLSFLAAVFISLPGCPSRWQGDSAQLVISFYGAGRAVYDTKDSETHQKLEHRIVLTSGTEILRFSFKGAATFEASVTPGNWNVRVDSWQDEEIYATGSKDVVLKLGQNKETMLMYQAFMVTFDANGGRGAVQPVIVKAGESITLPNGSGLSRAGYIFGGWSADADADGTEASYAAGSTYMPEGSVTLYARWEEWMVQVAGGSFQMGKELGTDGSGDETPVHTVTLSGFNMGKYPVTQAQYLAVMGENPSYFSSNPASGEAQGNRPVEYVSWYDAVVFCNKLSMAEGLSPAYSISGSTNPSDWGTVPTKSGNSEWNAAVIVSGSEGYRLPTEAQWEYAAKGGNGSPGNYTYAGSNNIEEVAWYNGNSDSKTHEVGKKSPNGLGLYDMSGNVWEWCWDWYGSYSSDTQDNPTGAAAGDCRVIRGGSWLDDASYARSVSRYGSYPFYRYGSIGFRLVRP